MMCIVGIWYPLPDHTVPPAKMSILRVRYFRTRIGKPTWRMHSAAYTSMAIQLKYMKKHSGTSISTTRNMDMRSVWVYKQYITHI